jgi:hypothetical protein
MMATTSAQRQAALKARKQGEGLQLLCNLWVKPEDAQAVRAFAAGGTLPPALTKPAYAVGASKTVADPATETTEQLCASLAWQFAQLGDSTYRATGQGVIDRILKTLKERAKHGN